MFQVQQWAGVAVDRGIKYRTRTAYKIPNNEVAYAYVAYNLFAVPI